MTLQDRQGRPFRVRELCRETDRETVAGFYDAFEPKRAAQGLPPEGAFRISRWLDNILRDGTHLLVEEADGAVVGHAFLVPTDRPEVAEYAIFLDHGIRGRGVGTQVNHVAADVARSIGVRSLWLSVEPHNRAAVRSYEKAGFRFLPGTIYSPEAEMQLALEEEPVPAPL
ncbi:MAG: GNAT family N-acetyltransferase [Gemmatimonadetes bacterium]|nr:GNAT family N-acetyltransferase [Gemmatimonadota bacterium]